MAKRPIVVDTTIDSPLAAFGVNLAKDVPIPKALAPGLFTRAIGYGIKHANAEADDTKRPAVRIRRIKSPGADAPRLAWLNARTISLF